MAVNYGIYTDMYNNTIQALESGKMIPNIKAIKSEIRGANKSVRIISGGSAFCADMEMLKKTDEALRNANDRLNALNAILSYVNKKIDDNKKQNNF